MDTFQFRLNNGKNKLFPCLYCGSLVKVQLIVLSFLQIHHLWANTNCKRKLPSFRFGVIYAVFFFSFAKISQKKSFRITTTGRPKTGKNLPKTKGSS